VMFLGVRFQSHPPTTVTVELWDAPPPPPQVVEEPKPPPPAPKPEPEVQPEVKKPEIVLPEKPKPKPKPPPPKRDLAFEKRLREQALNEQKQLDEQRRERELRELIARQQAAATSRALAAWTDKIRAKIKGNIILPQEIPGNPEAIFDVTLHAGYDDAVERAINKSSPLPLPDDRGLFRRDLELKFRPQELR